MVNLRAWVSNIEHNLTLTFRLYFNLPKMPLLFIFICYLPNFALFIFLEVLRSNLSILISHLNWFMNTSILVFPFMTLMRIPVFIDPIIRLMFFVMLVQPSMILMKIHIIIIALFRYISFSFSLPYFFSFRKWPCFIVFSMDMLSFRNNRLWIRFWQYLWWERFLGRKVRMGVDFRSLMRMIDNYLIRWR